MFASMQRLAVALLVVAFVPARVPAEVTDRRVAAHYVSDFYSATSHTVVGSFKYSDSWSGIHVSVEKPFQFVSKYPYVAIMLYSAQDVSRKCTIHGPALTTRHGDPIAIYSGRDTGLLNNSDFTVDLWIDFLDTAGVANLDAVAVLYSNNAEDPKPSPIACGQMRHPSVADPLFHINRYKITKQKPTGLPSASNRQMSRFMLLEPEAVSHLYYTNRYFAGSMVYRTVERNSLEVALLGFSGPWDGKTIVAVVYHLKDVMPRCVTTGPAVSIRDELNATRPLILFMDEYYLLHNGSYGNVVDYASMHPVSNFEILDGVVVLYAFEPPTPIVLEDFLQPTNSHNGIACGGIRSVDASEDNFMKWAPASPQPTPMSETMKWLEILARILQGVEVFPRKK